jgi:hypothetical protein
LTRDPKPPWSFYPLQAGIGMVLIVFGIIALVLRNTYATNPIPWIAAAIGIVVLLFLAVRSRDKISFMGLFRFFNRGSSDRNTNDWNDSDFDPSRFSDRDPKPDHENEPDSKSSVREHFKKLERGFDFDPSKFRYQKQKSDHDDNPRNKPGSKEDKKRLRRP